MPNRKRDSEGRFTSDSWTSAARNHPVASAAAAAGVAAAGAFLWSKRDKIGSAVNSGMDRVSQMKSERMGSSSGRSQDQIAEEAMTLKETGKKTKGPRGPIAQQEIKAGAATAY